MSLANIGLFMKLEAGGPHTLILKPVINMQLMVSVFTVLCRYS